jgi:hypothetical protein
LSARRDNPGMNPDAARETLRNSMRTKSRQHPAQPALSSSSSSSSSSRGIAQLDVHKEQQDLYLSRGCLVVIRDLRNRAELNGKEAEVLDAPRGQRCTVKCDGDGEVVAVKPQNLTVTAGWPLETLELPPLINLDASGRRELLRTAAAKYRLTKVTGLSLSHAAESITTMHLEMIAEVCSSLRALDLEGCDGAVYPAGIRFVTMLPALRVLSLARCVALSDGALCGLAAGPPVESDEVMSGLRSRGLWATLGAALGGAVAGFRQLKELDLTGCSSIGDDGVAALADGTPCLTALRLAGCVRVGDRALCAIAHNGYLTIVTLDDCVRVTDLSVCALARLCPLAKLGLAGRLQGVTPFALRALAEERGATTLTALDLSRNPDLDADAAVSALAGRCPRLRCLGLHDCTRLTSSGLEALRGGGLPALESTTLP